MKNVLKYSFLLVMSLTIACGNAATEKEIATEKVTAEVPQVKEETSASVSIDRAGEETQATTIVEEKTLEKEEKVNQPKSKVLTKPKEQTKAKPTEVITEKEAIPSKSAVENEKSTVVEEKATSTTKVQSELAKVDAEKEIIKKEEVVQQAPIVEKATTPPSPPPFSHEAWNTLAQKHISSTGKVNYKGFKADITAFEAYLKSLADNPVQSSWSRAKKMAYWINAYNAFTIKLIVDNYPVKSIMDLHGGKPWDVKWIKLGDKTYSLNNIEHDILRPQYKDARIHFAVNCAAKSCPPVWNKAWTEQNLNGQLERSAKSFINNAKYNKIGENEVSISKIFEWYAVDFGDSIIDYLNKYATTKIDGEAKVGYQEYDWALNE